jgi:hypothetical protein
MFCGPKIRPFGDTLRQGAFGDVHTDGIGQLS